MLLSQRAHPLKGNNKTMDSSDEEAALICILLKKRKKKQRRFWIREHFLLRSEMSEFFTSFMALLESGDEFLFFNYTRMSIDTYKTLRALVLPHLDTGYNQFRQPITGEEKLILAIR